MFFAYKTKHFARDGVDVWPPSAKRDGGGEGLPYEIRWTGTFIHPRHTVYSLKQIT